MHKDRYQTQVGPVSEIEPDAWCIRCGHYKGVHHLNEQERTCKYWTDLCECTGFVSRSEALAAVEIVVGLTKEIIEGARTGDGSEREGG